MGLNSLISFIFDQTVTIYILLDAS